MIHDEIEIKLDLSNEANYRSILNLKLPETSPIRQENYFFDTPMRSLSAAGWALRIRKEGDRTTVTAKGPDRAESEGLAIREEIEEEIDAKQSDLLLMGDIDPFSLPTQIADTIVGLCSGRKLIKIVSFINYRTMIAYEASGSAIDMALDRTEYSDGSVDFELEVELSEKSKYKAIMAIFDRILDKAGVPVILRVESKYARALKKMSPTSIPGEKSIE
jgi:inorganic triphosphatase YgiF